MRPIQSLTRFDLLIWLEAIIFIYIYFIFFGIDFMITRNKLFKKQIGYLLLSFTFIGTANEFKFHLVNHVVLIDLCLLRQFPCDNPLPGSNHPAPVEVNWLSGNGNCIAPEAAANQLTFHGMGSGRCIAITSVAYVIRCHCQSRDIKLNRKGKQTNSH